MGVGILGHSSLQAPHRKHARVFVLFPCFFMAVPVRTGNSIPLEFLGGSPSQECLLKSLLGAGCVCWLQQGWPKCEGPCREEGQVVPGQGLAGAVVSPRGASLWFSVPARSRRPQRC